jgi:hypothetical protein
LKRGNNYLLLMAVKTANFFTQRHCVTPMGNRLPQNVEAARKPEIKFMASHSQSTDDEGFRLGTHIVEAGQAARPSLPSGRMNSTRRCPSGRHGANFSPRPIALTAAKSTLRQYEFQWQAFADWMKEKHPDILTLRDVTKEIAEEYASSMNHGRFSPSTYNKHLNLLTLVFRVVKHKAKLTGNPWESPKARRKPSTQADGYKQPPRT